MKLHVAFGGLADCLLVPVHLVSQSSTHTIAKTKHLHLKPQARQKIDHMSLCTSAGHGKDKKHAVSTHDESENCHRHGDMCTPRDATLATNMRPGPNYNTDSNVR